MRSVGFAILLGFGGAIVGALWTFAVGIGGMPGAMLTALGMKASNSEGIPVWGIILTAIGQLYVSLIFVVCVVLTAQNHIDAEPGVGNWVVWSVAFCVATVPSMAAFKDSLSEQSPTVQHGATPLSSLLSAVGFFVFVFAPSTIQTLWGWVPSF